MKLYFANLVQLTILLVGHYVSHLAILGSCLATSIHVVRQI